MPDDRQFDLEGPDDNGDVFVCSPEGRDVWCHNLGPWQDAAEIMCEWLGSVEYLERG